MVDKNLHSLDAPEMEILNRILLFVYQCNKIKLSFYPLENLSFWNAVLVLDQLNVQLRDAFYTERLHIKSLMYSGFLPFWGSLFAESH